jgi:hypothetical protein
MSEAKQNTDRLIHQNVDCRILFNEQHQLGIDIGGSVKFADPKSWHQSLRSNENDPADLDAFLKAVDEFLNNELDDPVVRATLFLNIIDARRPTEKEVPCFRCKGTKIVEHGRQRVKCPWCT